ncbi:hypothetical protein A3709_20590 [Halioglobus sp. HI00S01]|uniref:hypothetical protein n=1 Tax=Halioglobus sp. HI00S01 TaxID=1822214 RepID=UPI0007C3BF76|nr:hypothetical protein [Halioglobus sp. HI00S01]KZX58012.1 hypothetical protein A3709_20590 [Halioglobus sp. HI00S01]
MTAYHEAVPPDAALVGRSRFQTLVERGLLSSVTLTLISTADYIVSGVIQGASQSKVAVLCNDQKKPRSLRNADTAHNLVQQLGVKEYWVIAPSANRNPKADTAARQRATKVRTERRREARRDSKTFYQCALQAFGARRHSEFVARLKELHPQEPGWSVADWQAQAGFVLWLSSVDEGSFGYGIHSEKSAAYLFFQCYGPFDTMEDAELEIAKYSYLNTSGFRDAIEDEIRLFVFQKATGKLSYFGGRKNG